MNKQELLKIYSAEQLAEMVVGFDIENTNLKEELLKKTGLCGEAKISYGSHGVECRCGGYDIAVKKNKELQLEVEKYKSTSEVKNDEIHKLKWQISSLEEDNGRLQAKLDTYNDYLLPRATKEAKEMIDHNHFSGVRIVTCEQWNNRDKSEEKSCFPKEYEQTVKEILNIDTSQIQDDCHRFGVEGLQKYLKNPVPIKISKRNDENMNISDIQKCQEEYEKFLKESPMESTINKISRDILEQKNNAMAMEFTRIICDLLKRYGVHVHCTETKLSEKITTNFIKEQYGIAFDSMDFSQHDKEFTDEIEKLQSEVEKYRKAFEDAKKEHDCQISKYQKKIDELTAENKKYLEQIMASIPLSYGYSVSEVARAIFEHCNSNSVRLSNKNRFDYSKEREKAGKDGCEIYILGLIKCLQGLCAGEGYTEENVLIKFIPTEPIKIADMLINADGEYEHNPVVKKICGTDKGAYRIFDISELKQIAEHLLVYCNHNGEVEENE